MGCNCGKPQPQPGPNTGSKPKFALETNGRTQTFGSQLEAQAANVRQGGQGIIKPLTRF